MQNGNRNYFGTLFSQFSFDSTSEIIESMLFSLFNFAFFVDFHENHEIKGTQTVRVLQCLLLEVCHA